ncbi:tetraacyldisaccharide 4'-kinase [Crenobacter sp. SG2303]|uniref:Tetraacyldisaccharide 4'-kinase n=1 Tax=Crenobacter oryzisoli TaxID=3056844 RepID=A0ABT7XTY9_9NEIS|nr:tetraacyldisaccharide 4'-kinase [Crenobacter sp. SG2303]MDN0077262.1 tetraacyldisaccharide 4'-kinase [Crenobacter sp. SG2303]
MSGRIERHWYRPKPWLTALLAPLAGLFALLATLRRCLFQSGVLRVHKVARPVVVIGNINVGGVGKTPLTQSLIARFAEEGVKVGVVSRGYGGDHVRPTLVGPEHTPAQVGDEPLLIAATSVPVVVGRDRVAAAEALIAAHPELDLILSDDGLQHYRLGRDLEVVVVDGARGFGNGCLLPNGPLREPPGRLRRADALVINGAGCATLAERLPDELPKFVMRLAPERFVALADPSATRRAADFAGEKVVALAGIGHPERFFATLASLGIEPARTLAFPDHHAFVPGDIPQDADAVLVTAKDAVKLRAVNHAKLWVLPVAARVEPDLAGWILRTLKIPHGR